MIDLEPTQQTPTPTTRRKAPGWFSFLTIVLVMAGLAAVGSFAFSEDSPTVTTAAETDDTGAVQNEPVSSEPDPADTSSDEPIADAAEVILPSVVQIQLRGGGVGSGVIYDPNGLILTAAHVVEDNETVTVRFQDGEEVTGTVIGGNADADVAVVQVERSGLPAAELALDETPRVGQMAIAVGSPWGLDSTVTAGIISAINQPLCDATSTCQSMLQTDAAINPGNSGGALVDRLGRVVGINVSIFTLSGANDGVGFAVPIDIAYDVADRLVSGESLAAAYLGVTGDDVASGQAGALITEVQPGTGAADAGVEVGDLIIALEDVEIQGIADLASQVRRYRPGTIVELLVVRDGAEIAFQVMLGERPATP
jgi:S1-C subfamily serine protease